LVGLLIIIVSALGLFLIILAIVLAFPAALIVAESGLFIIFKFASLIAAAILAFFALLVCPIILTAISAIIAFSVLLLLVLLK